MNAIPSVFLASRSLRRRELLHQIHVKFEVLLFRAESRVDGDVSEDLIAGEDAVHHVTRVARAKAAAGVQRVMRRRLQSRPVLSADTTLEVDGAILGQPNDDGEAAEMLRSLSGRRHRVLTAVALCDDERMESLLSVSEVSFCRLTPEDIQRYLASGEYRGKAGAYGIQGRAALFVEEIHGSYTGIMGLPLYETAQLLHKFGYPI